MALKTLLLRKKIDLKKKELSALRASMTDVEKREDELIAAVEEVSNDEEQAAVQESVDALTEEKEKLQGSIDELDKIINDLEAELVSAEEEQNIEPEKEPEMVPGNEERSNSKMMTRSAIETMVTRDDVKAYLGEVRSCIREKRALTNVGLTVPEVFLGYLRENIEDYSKLYKHINVRPIAGDGRMVIAGAIPEAIWTDCCANLNELDLAFYGMEVDCFRVAGYFAVCNATMEDSDLDLAAELLKALGQAMGIALDKAILFGRNAAGAMKMPQGIVSRLVQTEEPAGYPAQARPWVDLHTSNVKAIDASTTGIDLFKALTIDAGAAKGKYSKGEKVHVMNETTYTYLQAQAMSVNAAGAIVTGVEGTMPVIGGAVEILDFIPDYIIISGYFDLYLLAERAGKKFASSEHVKFLQDQTVFKGTARYDGGPAIAEAFVAIGVNGASVDATAVAFGEDKANAVNSIALNTSTASVAVSSKVQLFAIVGPGAGTVEWSSATTGKATVDSNGVVTGVATGSSVITATCNGLTASATVTVTAE